MLNQPAVPWRILVISTAPGIDPSEPLRPKYVREQVQSLKTSEFAITTFGFPPERDPLSLLRGWWRVRQHVRILQPQIIHIHYGGVMALCSLAASVGRSRHALTIHGSDLLLLKSEGFYLRLKSALRNFITRRCCVLVDAIIAVSENLRRQIPPNCQQKAIVIPCGVDLMSFRPASKSKARAQLGLDPSGFYVLFNASSGLGQENPIKNPALAERSVELLRELLEDVRLLKLQCVPEDLMPKYINAVDALLVTSHFEGSPQMVKEALACELPVVSVECGDVVTRIQGLPNCHIVARRPDDIARALYEVSQTTGRATGARERLMNDGLDLQSIADKMLSTYRRLANSQSGMHDEKG